MPATIMGNVLTSRPSEVALLGRSVLAAKHLLGATGIRFNAAFELIFPTTSSPGVFTGLDEMFAQASAEGLTDLIAISISPYVSTADASWTTLVGSTFGTAGWISKKRLPMGTGGSGTAVAEAILSRLQDTIDHIADLADQYGIPRRNVAVQIFQEPALRYSDGVQETSGSYPAKTDAIAAGYSGYWDNSGDWDAIATASGKAQYAGVVGLQEWLDYLYPQVDMRGLLWMVPSIANGDYMAQESQTIFQGSLVPAVTPWWQAMLDYEEAETGTARLHIGVHVYPGDMFGAGDPSRLSPETIANRFRWLYARSRSTLYSDNHGVIDHARWYVMEFGVQPEHLFRSATNASDEYQEAHYGRILAAVIGAASNFAAEAVCFEELVLDSSGTEHYHLVDTSGNVRKAAAVVARSRGIETDTGSAPTWDAGLAWATGAPNEPAV